jgi:hypothetical protein
MPIGLIVAGVGLAIAGAGAIASASAQSKQANALKQQTALQRQQTQLQGMRQRLDAIRTGRQALAQVQQTAENQGVSSSSAAQGGQGSIVSQMMSNVSFLDGYNKMTDLAQGYAAKALKYGNQANMWGAVENFGFKLANFGAGSLPTGGGG